MSDQNDPIENSLFSVRPKETEPQAPAPQAPAPQAPQPQAPKPQARQTNPQTQNIQITLPSSAAPVVTSAKNYFTLMIPLLKGYPEKVLTKVLGDSKLWIPGLIFAALSMGLLGANGAGVIAYNINSSITAYSLRMIPWVVTYGFFNWAALLIIFGFSGALFVVLRALALWLITAIMGQKSSYKNCLNLAAFAYSWMFALMLVTSFLVIISVGFFTLATLLAIPVLVACELFTFTGLKQMAEFKQSPIVAYAFFISFSYPLATAISFIIATGVVR